jgi:hypothetical protein
VGEQLALFEKRNHLATVAQDVLAERQREPARCRNICSDASPCPDAAGREAVRQWIVPLMKAYPNKMVKYTHDRVYFDADTAEMVFCAGAMNSSPWPINVRFDRIL